MPQHYCYLWEFRVAPEARAEFERHYGADGSWSQLFRRAEGYLGTHLLQDRADPGRFLTLDRWRSDADHRAFRTAFAQEYAALDRLCEALTLSETALGEYRE
jgi:heme-degrading monooxygenase HmoA